VTTPVSAQSREISGRQTIYALAAPRDTVLRRDGDTPILQSLELLQYAYSRKEGCVVYHVARSALAAFRLIISQNSMRSPMVFSYPNAVGSYHLAPRSVSGRYS